MMGLEGGRGEGSGGEGSGRGMWHQEGSACTCPHSWFKVMGAERVAVMKMEEIGRWEMSALQPPFLSRCIGRIWREKRGWSRRESNRGSEGRVTVAYALFDEIRALTTTSTAISKVLRNQIASVWT